MFCVERASLIYTTVYGVPGLSLGLLFGALLVLGAAIGFLLGRAAR